MNFGMPGFNILNVSSVLQVRVHQFHPDVVVVVTDPQILFPRWPSVVPESETQTAVKQLTWYEALFKRASEYNTVFSLLDNPVNIRQDLEKALHLPLAQPPLAAKAASIIAEDKAAAAPKSDPAQIRQYEARRSMEFGAPIAAVSSFYKEMHIPLYFMTPYGPYFTFTDKELGGFSLNMMVEASQIYGSLGKALSRQVELSTGILIDKAQHNGAHIINMLEPSRQSGGLKDKDFSTDGIHYTAAGNHHVGEIIADRLIADGICRG